MCASSLRVFLFFLILIPFQSLSPIQGAFITLPFFSDPLTLSLWENKIHCFPFHLYDIIYLSSVKIDIQGRILYKNDQETLSRIEEITTKAHNHKTKIILSVGGKVELYDNSFASLSINMQEFQKSVEKNIEELNLDGINIDWSSNPNEMVLKSIVTNFKSSPKTQEKLITLTNLAFPTLFADTYNAFDLVNVLNFNKNDEVSLESNVNFVAGRFLRLIKNEKILVAVNFYKYGQNEIEDIETTRLIKEAVEKFNPHAIRGISAWDVLYDSGAENKECQWAGSLVLAGFLGGNKKEL